MRIEQSQLSGIRLTLALNLGKIASLCGLEQSHYSKVENLAMPMSEKVRAKLEDKLPDIINESISLKNARIVKLQQEIDILARFLE